MLNKIQNNCRHINQEIDFKNLTKAVDLINTSSRMLLQFASANVQLQPYKEKGQIPMTSPQYISDMTEAKKQVKNAISELDFKNIPGCLHALNKASYMCHKY